MKPWGRLSLQSNKWRMDDNIWSNVIYYVPFDNDDYDYLSLNLFTAGAVQGNIYDVYLDTGTGAGNLLVMGSAWINSLTPSELRIPRRGLFYNTVGNLYLGSFYTEEPSTVRWQTRLNPTDTWVANELGLYNAYNKVEFTAINRSTDGGWTYDSNSPRYANNTSRFRVYWVDGLGDVSSEATYNTSVQGFNGTPAAATVGVGLDGDLNINGSTGRLEQAALESVHSCIGVEGANWFSGLLGRHFWQAVEETGTNTIQFIGCNYGMMIVKLFI